MKIISYISLTLLFLGFTSFSTHLKEDSEEKGKKELVFSFTSYADELYSCVDHNEINPEAFNIALKGYFALISKGELSNKKYLTIIDMSLSANAERFFVVDMETQKLVYKDLVAHGRNTGQEFAYNFSNKGGSYKTSLGFYKTGETYDGKRGFSMKLDGLEYSNNNARDRGIVIHGADYVSEKFIKENERLGRSLGCPALPADNFREVINILKEGSCLFIYFPQNYYLTKSKLVNIDDDYLLANSALLSSLDL